MVDIVSYHAHVYYDPPATRAAAELVRARIGERFVLRLGRWHDELVGPHLRSMFQVAFAPELFGTLVPWLMLNRLGLNVLVHPNTGAPRADHMTHSLWLGEVLPLNADALEISSNPAEDVVVPNTAPAA